MQPLLSVTFTVIGKQPTTVGVPERTPAGESVSPAGSVPLLSVNVVAPMALLAVKFWLNGAPAVPQIEHPTPGQTALFNAHEDAIECSRCGGRMVRAGTCYTCRDCGTSTGCG